MRIAVANITSGTFSGGYATYLNNVVPRLAAEPRVSALEVIVPESTLPLLDPALELIRPWPTGSRADGLRRAVHEFRPDVVFVPTARPLRLPGVPVVAMVRNMEPLTRLPARNPPREALRNAARRVAARSACRRSARVLAVSHHVRRFLMERWHLDPSRIGVVYHGVRPPLDDDRTSRPTSVPIERPFVFTAGSIRPARGLEDALVALALARSSGIELDLVIAGDCNPGARRYEQQLRRLAESVGVSDNVSWTGRLRRTEMDWCFSRCEAFVITSRAEACPNTALEAMSYGCISVSTDQAPMPEFFVDSATYYRGGDPEALAEALGAAVSLDEPSKRQWRAKARRRSADFDWSATAERTVSELELALT